jgi:hypothetical protein
VFPATTLPSSAALLAHMNTPPPLAPAVLDTMTLPMSVA